MNEVRNGEGYSVGSLDAIGAGPGFRKIRSELGVTAFGVNAIVLPAGMETGFHAHEHQQELYFVHAGSGEIEFGDGTRHRLEPGALARVDAPVARRLRSFADDDLVYVVIGAKDGYVGRDGIAVEPDEPRVKPS